MGCCIIKGAFETELRLFFQPLCLGGVSASGQSPDSDDFFPAKTLIVNSVQFAAMLLSTASRKDIFVWQESEMIKRAQMAMGAEE